MLAHREGAGAGGGGGPWAPPFSPPPERVITPPPTPHTAREEGGGSGGKRRARYRSVSAVPAAEGDRPGETAVRRRADGREDGAGWRGVLRMHGATAAEKHSGQSVPCSARWRMRSTAA